MENKKDSDEKYEINQLDKLEGYEKTNAELTTITDINELNNNKNKYQRINLSHNKLTEIKELLIFENLVYLDLSYNQFEKLKSLSPLRELEILILSNNFIRSINTNFFGLKKLQHLDLSNNRIDMSNNITITALKENTEIISLLLFGNNNYDFEKAKYLCLENLGKINFLDAKKIINGKSKKFKNKKINKSYISVQGIKGNQKNISTLDEYIKFKFEDFNNNQKDYENNIKNNQQKNEENLKELNNESKTSYYFLKYTSSC